MEVKELDRFYAEITRALGQPGMSLKSLEEEAGLYSDYKEGVPYSSRRYRLIRLAAVLCTQKGLVPPKINPEGLNGFYSVLTWEEAALVRKLPLLPRNETPLQKLKNRSIYTKASAKKVDDAVKIASFYKSYAWKEVRYAALVLSAGRCGCCKRSDLPLNVDHIKPVKKYWNLRLEVSNLQVLCGDCNHGKANWDETDWRTERQKLEASKVAENAAKASRRRFRLVE